MNAANGETDPYLVLGVARDAPQSTIRAAYRQLAIAYHPDTNHDPQAATRMIAVNAAYAALSDPARRAEFDGAHPRRCARCGLAIGLLGGTCRVCAIEDGPSARSTHDAPRLFRQACWSVQVDAPLRACTKLTTAALGAQVPDLQPRGSEMSDSKLEASLPLGAGGETAMLGARLWADDPTHTTLRVSLAADLPCGDAAGAFERAEFERLVRCHAEALEARLTSHGLHFATVR